MNNEIHSEVKALVASVLNVPIMLIGNDLKAGDLSEWDSLAQIRIVMEVEERFNIRVSSMEIMALNSVNKIVEYLER